MSGRDREIEERRGWETLARKIATSPMDPVPFSSPCSQWWGSQETQSSKDYYMFRYIQECPSTSSAGSRTLVEDFRNEFGGL